MRTLTATFFMALDGVVEAPETWNGAYWSDEMRAALGVGMAESDTFLYGRKTYDDMAAAWPEREEMGTDAETKEQMGGLWVIEVPDRETAEEWARKAAVAGECPVEVRPVQGG